MSNVKNLPMNVTQTNEHSNVTIFVHAYYKSTINSGNSLSNNKSVK